MGCSTNLEEIEKKIESERKKEETK